MKQILITLLLSVLTLFISLLLFINNYFKADEEYYILHNEKISSISRIVGKRNLKYKKLSTLLDKKTLSKTYYYNNIKNVSNDLNLYINYLRENENYLVTKPYDLNKEKDIIELSKYSKEENYIILLNIEYNKKSYKINISRLKGSIKND